MAPIKLTNFTNGIRVITEQERNFQTISLGIWVDAGSRNETIENNGISHLLEHMAFKGTTSRSAKDIVQEIENVGGYFNAYTSRENTAYYIKILKDDLPLAIDILIDIFINSTFLGDELKKEKEVIKQEIGQSKDTPDDIIFDYFQSAAFPDQPLGRSILGSVSNVNKFTRENVFNYLESEYSPNRLVFAASGDIEHDNFENLIREKLVDYNKSKKNIVEKAEYVGGEYRETRDLEQVHIVLGLEGVSYYDENYYPSQVFSTILGGGMSSKLFQQIRENKGLCYSIYSFSSSYTDTGLLGVYAGTGENQVKELIPSIIDEFHKMSFEISEEDVARAKAQLKASTIMSLENSSHRCESLARQLIIYDRPVTHREIIEKIESITRSQVIQFAKSILNNNHPVLSVLGPISRIENFEKIIERLRN